MNGLSFYSAITFSEPHICTKFSSNFSSICLCPVPFLLTSKPIKTNEKDSSFRLNRVPATSHMWTLRSNWSWVSFALTIPHFYQKAYLILPSTSRCSTTKGLQMIQIATSRPIDARGQCILQHIHIFVIGVLTMHPARCWGIVRMYHPPSPSYSDY